MKKMSEKKHNSLAELFGTSSFIPLNRDLVKVHGPNNALFISNLIDKYKYFEQEGKLKDGEYFYQTHNVQTRETGLTEYTIRKCKNHFKEIGVLVVKKMGVPSKEYYKLNLTKLSDSILSFTSQDPSYYGDQDPSNPNGQDLSNSNGQDLSNSNGQDPSNPVGHNNKQNRTKQNRPKQNKDNHNKSTYSSSSEDDKDSENSTKHQKTNRSDSNSIKPQDQKIKKEYFEKFWSMYPRKVHKGKAKTSWDRICNRKNKSDVPTFREVISALQRQKRTEQWQDKNFIPHPATWLNQSRWLDDPEEMKSFKKQNNTSCNGNKRKGSPEDIILSYFSDHTESSQKKYLNELYKPAVELMMDDDADLYILAENITDMLEHVKQARKSQDETAKKFTFNDVRLVKEYIEYLQDAKWIDFKTPNLFDKNSKVFKRFLIYISKNCDDRHPLTGEFIR